MRFRVKILLLSFEVVYLIFLTVTHFFHEYGISYLQKGLLGLISNTIRIAILLIIFKFFPDPFNDKKSKETIKRERSIFIGLLIIAILLILNLFYFTGLND